MSRAEKLLTDGEELVVSCVDFRGKHCTGMKVTLWINLRSINGCDRAALLQLFLQNTSNPVCAQVGQIKQQIAELPDNNKNNSCGNVNNNNSLINLSKQSVKSQ